jgi:PPOX class probable F420-dependent enzyme
MVRDMLPDEWRAFILEGTRTAKLAVTRQDGAPHVTPVWFVLDRSEIVVTTGSRSVKANSIRRDGRVALCVEDDRPPFSFVTIEGAATLYDDLDEMLLWATRIGARYMGEDRAGAFGRRNAVPGELLVRITPSKVIAKAEMAG